MPPLQTPFQESGRRVRSTLYEKLASRIESQISAGSLRSGERIPSIRELRAKTRMSISTILKAYEILENRGLVRAHPKSGYFVQPQLSDPVSAPNLVERPQAPCRLKTDDLIMTFVKTLDDPNYIKLGTTIMGAEMFPHKALGRLVSAAGRDPNLMKKTRTHPAGEPELRRQLARRSIYQGMAHAPDDFVITNGCMEALNVSLRAVARPGDTIAVDSPGFFGVMQAFEGLGMYALEIPTDPVTGLSLEHFETAVKKNNVRALLVMSNFGNPTGALMPDANKARLVEFAAQRGIPIIEDDIYGDLHHGLSRPRTLKSFDKKGNVILCSSFSKSLAPGFRVGWAIPGRFADSFLKIKFSSSIGCAPLLQDVIARFLKDGGYDRHLRKMRQRLKVYRRHLEEAIYRHLPRGTRFTRPAGGTAMWVQLARRIDTVRLFQTALRDNISFSPGPMFSPKGCFRNFMRLSFGTDLTKRRDRALARLGELIRKQR